MTCTYMCRSWSHVTSSFDAKMIPVLYCNNKHFKGKTEKCSIRYLFGEITVIFALYTTFCFSIPITLVLNQNASFTRKGTKFSWCPQKEKAFRQHKQWHKSLLMVKADTELETCVTSWDPVWWRKEVIPQQDTSSTTLCRTGKYDCH